LIHRSESENLARPKDNNLLTTLINYILLDSMTSLFLNEKMKVITP